MVLDQFKEGLKILGGFESNNSATKAVAVSEYDATDVLDKISFEYPDDNNHLLTYFEHYIRGKESEDIRNFIILCCSGYVLPTQQIKVWNYFGENVFVSTCSFKLDCPNAFNSFEELENTFEATVHASFNHCPSYAQLIKSDTFICCSWKSSFIIIIIIIILLLLLTFFL